MEWLILSRGNNQLPVGNPPVTVEISLPESINYVIAGIRIMGETAPKQTVTIFNSKVPLGTVSKSVTEIGFCDAEILSIQNNKITFSIESEDTQLKLKSIEIFVINKDDFNFARKVQNLEQMILKKFSSKIIELGNYISIISTKSYKILAWDQKEGLLNKAIEKQDELANVINCIDFLS